MTIDEAFDILLHELEYRQVDKRVWEAFHYIQQATDQEDQNLITSMALFNQKRSPQWEKIRNDHLAANPKCAACGTAESLEVHHVKPFHIFPELELDPNNLITLCEYRGCHLRFGHSFLWRAWNPSVVLDAQMQLGRIKNRRIN